MVEPSPEIGKVGDIPVQLHWTFILLLIFAFVLSWPGLYLFIVFVLLFACVFLHELAHSITAKRRNIPVQKIVLYPLGGGSIIDMENVKPDLEFRIALAGPATNFFLSGVFGLLVVFLPAGMIKVFIQLLFILNILLAVSNIAPAFPLDGGRIFRSYMQKKHNFLDATKITVKATNAVIVVLIIFTFAYVAVENQSFLYDGMVILWDFFIAAFLYGATRTELQAAFIKTYASGIKVRAALNKHYFLVSKNVSLAKLYSLTLKNPSNLIVFKEGDAYKVIYRLSENILSKAIKGKPYGSIDKLNVEAPKISYYANLPNALEKMDTYTTNILAVTKGNKLVGFLFRNHVESVIVLHISHKGRRRK